MIGNQKTYIKQGKKNENYKMFMTMNNNTTQQQHNSNTAQHNTTQQQERSQETKLREGINSEREEHSVKPQQRDHSIRLR